MYARDFARLATPIGLVEVAGTETLIERIRIGVEGRPCSAIAAAVVTALEQLDAFFAGGQRCFDLPLSPAATLRGGALRDAIVAIGFGQTLGYGEVARQIASSARAVGQACARNPFPLVVPCHRVLAAGGALGPYSAGDGPVTKRWLLEHERRWAGGDALAGATGQQVLQL